MPAQKSADLSEQLAEAYSRIAELEAVVATETLVAPQQAMMGSILESISDAFIAIDAEFRYVWANSEAERLLQHSRDQLLGRSVWEVFPAAMGSVFEEKCREAISRKSPREFDYVYEPWSRSCYVRVFPTKEGGATILWQDVTEQRSLQLDLRRQALVLDQLHNSIVTADLKGIITHWNRGAEKMFGYAAAEVVGGHLSVLYFDEDREQSISNILESVLLHGQFEVELRNRHKSGRECRINLYLSLLRDEQNEPYAVSAISVDITAQRNTEQALRESEERFRLAAQALGGFVYDWIPQTGVVHRSGNIGHILGVNPNDVQPTVDWWQERVHPEDELLSSKNVLKRLNTEISSFQSEFRMRHGDGHWVHVCDRGYIVRDVVGAPIRVVGITHDITERTRLEREIQETNKQLRFQAMILATTDEAVVAIDPYRLVTYLTPGAERMYGVSKSEALGNPLSALHGYTWLHPDDERRCWSDLAEHGSWKGEYIHIRNDGVQLIVSSTVNLLPEEFGGGMVSVTRDVTEKKRSELESQKNAAELARANEELLHFAYAVSHDLQAPLRTVVSFSQLLELKHKARLDEQGSEFIRLIVEAGNRMSAMLRDLLALVTCAAGETPFSQNVSLEDVLAMALANLGSEVRATGALITHDTLPEVTGDAGQFAQLFQNLMGNSIKYRKPETRPEIHISAVRSGDEWIINFRDRGIGFEPDQAQRIFGVFKRLHGAEFSGTGVGLAICKRIVDRRGGRIWATAKPGDGAQFSFTIPDGAASPKPQELQSQPKPTPTAPILNDTQPVPSAPFEELFQTLDLAHATVRDMEGKVLVWTRGSERLFQWPKEQVIGKHLHKLLRTEFSIPFQQIEAELQINGEWKGQLRKFRQDGRAVWVASHWALYRDGSGRGQSVIEVDNDITALKEAEEALKRSGEQRDLALSAGQMGIWHWDCRTGLVEWDGMVERLHGMQPGTFQRTFQAYKERVHPDDFALIESRLSKAMQGDSEYSVEHRAIRVDGSCLWLRGQGQVLREAGEVIGLIGVVWQISPRTLDQEQR